MSQTKTTLFDAASYIDNEEDVAAFLAEAARLSGDEAITPEAREIYTAHAHEIVERARSRWVKQ